MISNMLICIGYIGSVFAVLMLLFGSIKIKSVKVSNIVENISIILGFVFICCIVTGHIIAIMR